MKTKLAPNLIAALALAAFCCMLAAPTRCMAYVSDGISLWAVSVLPVALPLLFLTGVLAETPLFHRLSQALSPLVSRLFGVSGAGGCAALLSLLSGYPAGARAVQALVRSGRVAREEALRVACLASTSGPAFLVGVAGAAMAGDPAVGWLLLLAHTAGVYAVCLVLGRGKRAMPSVPPQTSLSLSEALSSSVLAVLTVGGAIAIFYAFGGMVNDALSPLALPAEARATVAGLLEMTTGCAALLASPTPLRVALAAFLVTFGGACVLLQQWSFLSETGIPLAKFLLVKMIQGALAALIALLLALLLL